MCTVCDDPIHPGQRRAERGTAHESCAVVTLKSEDRCMGRRCPKPAEYVLSAIDQDKGLHNHPMKLCKRCLLALDANGGPVDIFRWLTDNRIEANA